MRTDVNDEAKLRCLFESVVGTVGPPTTELVAAGLARGLRLRRRRNVVMVAMAAVIATVVGAGAVAVTLSRGGPGRTVSPAATETLAPLDPRSAVAILSSLLPPDGSVSTFSGIGELGQIPDSVLYGSLTYDDGAGATTTAVSIGFVEDDFPPCGPDPDPSCQATELPDGSVLVTADGQEVFMPGQGGPGELTWPPVQWGVSLIRPDGMRILVVQWNSVETTGQFGPTTRPGPSLTTDEMTAIVQSPLWQATVPLSIVEAGRRLEPFRER